MSFWFIPALKKIAAIKKYKLISIFSWTGSINNESFYPCAIGKSHVNPCNKNSKKYSNPDSNSVETEILSDKTKNSENLLNQKLVSEKSKRLNDKKKSRRSRPLAPKRDELILTDIEGPTPIESFNKNK